MLDTITFSLQLCVLFLVLRLIILVAVVIVIAVVVVVAAAFLFPFFSLFLSLSRFLVGTIDSCLSIDSTLAIAIRFHPIIEREKSMSEWR